MVVMKPAVQTDPSSVPQMAEQTPALPRVYAWFNAVNTSDLSLLADLTIHGVPIDILHPLRHTTALMEATRRSCTVTVEWLLAKGAAPAFLCGLPKGSALHCALRRRHWAAAVLLLTAMDNTAILDAYGLTPLHALCVDTIPREELSAALGIAETLLRKGCPLNALDHEGITALHHCILNDAAELAELLLSHGANANALIPDSWVSPLMIAALEKNTAIAALLMRYGADPHLKTRDGMSPVEIFPAILAGGSHS